MVAQMANTVYTCLADIMYYYLRNNSAASSLRDLVVDGADGILKAGSLTPAILNSADKTRRTTTSTNPTLVLACSVQRGREVPLGRERFQDDAHIRIYDRGQGDELLKPTGDVVIQLLNHFRGHHTEGQGVGLLTTEYVGRSGIAWDNTYQVLYEMISYTGIIMRSEA